MYLYRNKDSLINTTNISKWKEAFLNIKEIIANEPILTAYSCMKFLCH